MARDTNLEVSPQRKIEDALTEMGLIATSFLHGKIGIAFTVNGKRVHLTYALLKLSTNVASVKRAIEHQLGG